MSLSDMLAESFVAFMFVAFAGLMVYATVTIDR